jgi:hypothetical protein
MCSSPAEPRVIWPPDGALVDLPLGELATVTDPDGDSVTLSVNGITQDEPVHGNGASDTAPDAEGIGSPIAHVRAERDGGGNGRVYAIHYTAADGRGGTCTGLIRAVVPHDQSTTAATDDGQQFDSTK